MEKSIQLVKQFAAKRAVWRRALIDLCHQFRADRAEVSSLNTHQVDKARIALHFGADDFGGTLFDENVMQEAGFYNRTTVDEVKTLIREAGFVPAQRTTMYDVVAKFDEPVAQPAAAA